MRELFNCPAGAAWLLVALVLLLPNKFPGPYAAYGIEMHRGSLTDWIGSLTENCRGRAVKHHTAPHWSTGLQIEAHEQNLKRGFVAGACEKYSANDTEIVCVDNPLLGPHDPSCRLHYIPTRHPANKSYQDAMTEYVCTYTLHNMQGYSFRFLGLPPSRILTLNRSIAKPMYRYA